MHKSIFNYLSEYNYDAHFVDSLITSAFSHFNHLAPHNGLIRQYLIDENSAQFPILKGFIKAIENAGLQILDFEQLIELFEFVVSPAEKIVNGAVYTPKYIRDYITAEVVRGGLIDDRFRLADIACGCGGFLLTAAKKIKDITGRPYAEIYHDNLFGVDITSYSIERTRILLSLWAIINNEDAEEFTFNLFEGNSIVFNWNEVLGGEFEGFDVVLGNPPYVASRNMDQETLDALQRWDVTRTGHPDLYIPFFQIGYELLKTEGTLAFITVNTFIKSINGRALRQYFALQNIDVKIVNFGGQQVFADRNTYTCLCFLRAGGVGGIRYKRCQTDALNTEEEINFLNFRYAELNHFDGWNLVNTDEIKEFVSQIETVGQPFKDIYTTKNGIATLKNDIFKFKPEHQNDDYYFFIKSGIACQIERGICRDIVNSNKLKSAGDVAHRTEKIIFPYVEKDGRLAIIDENTFENTFPHAFRYLKEHREQLKTRDKGKKKYEAWFAYGRRQSMDRYTAKLFFPHICEKPRFVLSEDADLLFYNGIAVVSDNIDELIVLKKLLESRLFLLYIQNTTKDYASGYISLSRNYLKNFGIYPFNEEQRHVLLTTDDPDAYLANLYGVNYFD